MDAGSEQSIRDVLARVEIFQPIEPDELARLASRAVLRRYGTGEIVFREGEAAVALYVIAAGTVAIRLNGSMDRPVSVLGPGNFFGEVALIVGAGRNATVTAESEATLVELPGSEILSLASRCLPFRVSLGKIGTTRSCGSMAARLSSRAQARGARPGSAS